MALLTRKSKSGLHNSSTIGAIDRQLERSFGSSWALIKVSELWALVAPVAPWTWTQRGVLSSTVT